jgi:hypothetical protein
MEIGVGSLGRHLTLPERGGEGGNWEYRAGSMERGSKSMELGADVS